MSNEFIALRARVRDKRDKAIAEARRDYEAALVQIASLEQDLLGKVSSRYKLISAAIESVIPSDRTFSTLDVLTALEALDPSRTWRKRSIDNHFSRLRERGLIVRLKRATIHEPAVYVRNGVEVSAGPLGDLTLREVLRKVVKKPVTTMEAVVAVLEAGYQTNMKRQHVGRELKAAGYGQVAGKWVP